MTPCRSCVQASGPGKKREKDGRAAAHEEDRYPDGVDRYFTDTNGSTMTARDEVSGRK